MDYCRDCDNSGCGTTMHFYCVTHNCVLGGRWWNTGRSLCGSLDDTLFLQPHHYNSTAVSPSTPPRTPSNAFITDDTSTVRDPPMRVMSSLLAPSTEQFDTGQLHRSDQLIRCSKCESCENFTQTSHSVANPGRVFHRCSTCDAFIAWADERKSRPTPRTHQKQTTPT